MEMTLNSTCYILSTQETLTIITMIVILIITFGRTPGTQSGGPVDRQIVRRPGFAPYRQDSFS